MTAVLRVEELSVTYPGRVQALDRFTLAVGAGEVVGLVGETGSGKSTLAWVLVGISPRGATVTQGQVMFLGKDLLRVRGEELRRIRGSEIGLVVQNARSHLNPLLSIGKQLETAYATHHRAATHKDCVDAAVHMLESVAIPEPVERLRAYPHELSGGMAQRVLIALALLHSPQFIVADEPTMGLDVTIQAQVLDLLRDRVSRLGSASLLVTRDLGIVAHYCDRVGVMRRGRLVELCSVRTLFHNPKHSYTKQLVRAASLDTSRSAQPLQNEAAPRPEANVSRTVLGGSGAMLAAETASEEQFEEVEEGHWVRGEHHE